MNNKVVGSILLVSTMHLFPMERLPSLGGQEKEPVRVAFTNMVLKLDLVLGNSKNKDESFVLPIDIAVDNEHRIYVADYEKSRIAVFSEAGSYLESIGRNRKEILRLYYPLSICLDSDGTLFISQGLGKIFSVSKERKVIGGFSIDYPAHKILVWKDSLFTGHKGSDFNLYRYSKEGELAAKLDSVPIEDEEKARAIIAVDAVGSIYLGRKFSPSITKLSLEGKVVGTFAYDPIIANRKEALQKTAAFNRGSFNISGSENPILKDIAVDQEGFVYLLVVRDHDQAGLSSLWRVNPTFQSFEKVDLPFFCNRIRIDQFNNFYFTGSQTFPYVFRFRVESPERPAL